MGEANVVPKSFAEEKLTKIAGYRNRLVRFYAEVSVEELYLIITSRLNDFLEFLSFIKDLLKDPESHDFTITWKIDWVIKMYFALPPPEPRLDFQVFWRAIIEFSYIPNQRLGGKPDETRRTSGFEYKVRYILRYVQ